MPRLIPAACLAALVLTAGRLPAQNVEVTPYAPPAPTLDRATNAGLCWLSRVGAFCEEVQAAGVAEQVRGLMKACYLALAEGRRARAIDLARQAHALDPRRVEADPLVWKLHLLDEGGGCEECEPATCPPPECPRRNPSTQEEAPTGSLMFGLGVNSDAGLTGSIVLNERNFDLSIRPQLPPVDPEIPAALEEVSARAAEPEPCCPWCAAAKQLGRQALVAFLDCVPEPTAEKGYLRVGLSPTGGIRVHFAEKVAGMKVLVLYRDGIPIFWVQRDDAPAE